MAPSPIIPTSFVPKQPVRASVTRPRGGATGFSVVAFGLLILSIVAAGAVFAYEKYLSGVRDADVAALEAAKAEITGSVVDDFVRMRDRFSAAETILDRHIAFSGFLNKLEGVTLSSVQFKTLSYDNDGVAVSVRMTGSARSFNTLAAQSNAIAEVKELRRAIFSGIAVDPATGIVQFAFTADVDPSLIAFELPTGGAVQAVSVSTTTATTTPKLPQSAPQKPATTTP